MKKLALLLKLRRYSLALYIPLYLLAKKRPIQLKDCAVRFTPLAFTPRPKFCWGPASLNSPKLGMESYGKIALVSKI